MPNNYYNILYVQLLSWDKNNFARVTSNQKSISKVIFGKTSYKDLDFGQNEFLRLVGAPNVSLILIIIYYIVKYLVGIKTTLLESLRIQKSILKATFRQN